MKMELHEGFQNTASRKVWPHPCMQDSSPSCRIHPHRAGLIPIVQD